MTNLVSQADPRTLSIEDIYAEISSFGDLGAAILVRWASLMQELARRKVNSPMFAHPIMRFWKNIVDNSLHPEAAMLLCGSGSMISAILHLSRDRQLAIAMGEAIPVATIAPDGTIRSDDLPIVQMDTATLRRAFCNKGIRSVSEQADIIRNDGRMERRGMFTLLHREGVVRIGNQKISPTDPNLRACFLELGFAIVPVADIPAKADAS